MSSGTRAVLAVGAVAGVHYLPSVLTVPLVNRRMVPALSGRSSLPHVALTFDDGPDPRSTPAFLDALASLGVRATFFVLGTQLAAQPALGRRLVDEGHEVAVHAWRHRPHLLQVPWQVMSEVHRTVAAVESVCGVRPRYWRPPNGIVSGAGFWAAHRAGLRPVLWTADGRDWAADATAASIVDRVTARLEPGGVVLLHDSDVTSAAGSWRAALAALPDLIARCRSAGWAVGPLGEHGL